MSLALTNSDIVYQSSQSATTSAALRALLDTALLAGGWSHQRSLTLGYVYETQSPQALFVRLRVQDTGRIGSGFTNLVDVQLMDSTETYLGYNHGLGYGSGVTYQALVGKCQFFFSRFGISNADQSYCCGGIPFIPQNVSGLCSPSERLRPATPITQAFWSCGPGEGQTFGSVPAGFRNDYACRLWGWSALLNTDLMVQTSSQPYDPPGRLRLFPLTPTMQVEPSLAANPPRALWVDGATYFKLDPLIGWGTSASKSSAARIRGQLWDAMIVSVDKPLDWAETLDNIAWINFCHSTASPMKGIGSYYSSLYLAYDYSAAPGGDSNYVY